jgi:hypothetical protein
MNQTSKTSIPSQTMNSWYQMIKTLSLNQEDANYPRKVEKDTKIATNNAIGESFVTDQQFHCTSNLAIHVTTAKCEIFLQQTE